MPTILQVLTFRSVCLSSIGTNCANDSKVRSRWSYNRGTKKEDIDKEDAIT